jgi:hypothetical protein
VLRRVVEANTPEVTPGSMVGEVDVFGVLRARDGTLDVD